MPDTVPGKKDDTQHVVNIDNPSLSTRPGVRAGPGLMRTTLCSPTTAGHCLGLEELQRCHIVLGRNNKRVTFYVE